MKKDFLYFYIWEKQNLCKNEVTINIKKKKVTIMTLWGETNKCHQGDIIGWLWIDKCIALDVVVRRRRKILFLKWIE